MKTILKLLILVGALNCSSSKELSLPNASIGLTENLKIHKDSIDIITPYIEISQKLNGKFLPHPDNRKLLKNLAIETIKTEFTNSKYFEIPLMSKDYKTINSVVEGAQTVPTELLVNNDRYSIYMRIHGYYGELNGGNLNLFLIDNKNKSWKAIHSYSYNYSPLDLDKTRKRILRALRKL